MLVYLDPRLYIYSQAVWQSRAFESRLLALIEVLNEIIEVEKGTNLSGRIMRFRTNEELQEVMLRNNPFVNIPPIAGHYLRLFQNKVLPELYKRSDVCPEGICQSASLLIASPQPAVSVEDEVQTLFRSLLEICGMCGHADERSLVFHRDDTTLSLPDPYFSREVDIASFSWKAALECSDYFPRCEDVEFRDRKLIFAIETLFSCLSLHDGSWSGASRCTPTFSDYFWESLSRSNFRGEERLYHARIIFTLVQILYGRDINIEAHGMSPQKIRHNDKDHFKWNAYVFKMGATAIDARCSRIYFARVNADVLINEYEPDAHP